MEDSEIFAGEDIPTPDQLADVARLLSHCGSSVVSAEMPRALEKLANAIVNSNRGFVYVPFVL